MSKKTSHRMHSLFSRTIRACLCILFLFVIADKVQAQSHLKRVSISERSDHKGFVVRYHMDQPADSFDVFQPTRDLIQLAIYKDDVDTTDIQMPDLEGPFEDVALYKIPEGLGVDIYLADNKYFLAEAYPDKNGHDLLMGLTKASRKDVDYLTKDLQPIIWSRYTLPDSELVSMNGNMPRETNGTSFFDDTYYKAKDKLRFDVVVIDAGHGGKDPGSIGYKGTKEKDVALAVALKLGHYINKYLPDVKVVYTRDDDSFVELKERGRIANQAEGDLFISIHCNSHSSRRPHGTEVYFLGLHRSQSAFEVMKKENSVIKLESGADKSTELSEDELLIYELANSGYMASSERLAGMISHQFKDRARRHSRGVKQAGFIVLYHASMPAILAELGFITNPAEQRFLTSDYGQSIMASALFRAIRNYKEKYEKSQHFTTN